MMTVSLHQERTQQIASAENEMTKHGTVSFPVC